MTIGIDASRANHAQKTGVEWYAFFVIQELKKIIPSNIQVILYSDVPLVGDIAVLPSNWCSKVLFWPPHRFWTQIRMSWEMLIHPPDVLFIPAHVFPFIHPKKTVMTVHDIAGVKFPHSYNWFERWYSTWSSKYAAKKLWQIIVPSEFTKKELVDFIGLDSVHSEHIHVVEHGYDERFHESVSEEKKKDILKKYAITEPYLLSIGRLEEKKNTWRIIKAFEQVKQNPLYADYQLVLVGQPGFGYERVKQVLDMSLVKKDILTPGWVGKDDLPGLLQNAQAFVFPSLYEGFGIPVLEAFASRTPCIVSQGSSLEEVGGSAVEVIDPLSEDALAQGIVRVLSEKEETAKKVEQGRQRVLQFSWRKSTQQVFEILRKK